MTDRALRIRSARRGGFRRAGRRFSPEGRIIPLDDLREAEIAALKAEPNLLVEEVARDDGADGGRRLSGLTVREMEAVAAALPTPVDLSAAKTKEDRLQAFEAAGYDRGVAAVWPGLDDGEET